jgi:anti-sigma-K factor RskA
MAHEDYKEMLPLHALTSLELDEAKTLDQHLATCAECRAEMDQWQGTVGSLAYATDPLEPSPQVRDRILEAVRSEARTNQRDNVVPLRPRAAVTSRSAGWPRALQAIAALVMLGLIVGVVALWRQNQAARASIAILSHQMDENRVRLQNQERALQVFSAPGARMMELAGTKEAPAAHATLVFDGKTKRAALMAEGLPPAPAGKAYQLWFIAGSTPMPGQVFKTDSSGKVMMMSEQVPAEALTAGAFAVTLEPERGMQSPTGAMYLLSPAKTS